MNLPAISAPAVEQAHPSAIEYVFAVGALFFSTDAVRVLILSPDGQGTVSLANDPVSLPGLLLMYAVTAILLAVRWRQTIRTVASVPWLVGVLVLAWASSRWSTDPSLTTKHAIWLTGSTLFGVYLHQRFGLVGLIRLLVAMFAILIVLSILFVILWPRLGVDPGLNAHAWRGVFPHKNSFGRMMVLAGLVFLIFALGTPRLRPLLVTLAVSAGGLVLMSRNASSLAVGVCLGLVFVFRNAIVSDSESETKQMARLLGFAVFTSILAIYYRDVLFGLLGRDSSLTGRTLLWAAVIQEILARPWLGFGFGSFWNGNTAEFARVWSVVRWAPPNAHNGYLDVILAFGMAGGAYVLLGLLTVAWRTLRFIARDRPFTLWPAAFVAYLLLGNISESALVYQNHLFWILFSSVVCCMAEASRADVQAKMGTPRERNRTSTAPWSA